MYMGEGTEGGIRYAGTFRPDYYMDDTFENVIDFSDKKERIITINLPLYGGVDEFRIGLKEGCILKEAPEYKINYINLGFSGNAKAEDTMIKYIKGLDMSIFVYDYDHNAPTVEHLRATHNKMFVAIREAHPDLPILILPRPKRQGADGSDR